MSGQPVGLYDMNDLVLIRAVTNLHPGTGRAGEVVDLPVQRDGIGYPIIYSSSLKGSLKSLFWNLGEGNNARELFGSEPDEREESFSSAIAILDALLVAFPVRSLVGVYGFATSPYLLKRLRQYCDIAGESCDFLNSLSALEVERGKCFTNDEALGNMQVELNESKNFIINERIAVQPKTDKSEEVKKLESFIGIESGRLIVLRDDDCLEGITGSLMKVTRTRLDRQTKTVVPGALWTEEYVPIGSVFATVVLYSRSKKNGFSSKDVAQKFREMLNKSRNYVIVGGDETVGKGIMRLEVKSYVK